LSEEFFVQAKRKIAGILVCISAIFDEAWAEKARSKPAVSLCERA
jgi:hypothetical protein